MIVTRFAPSPTGRLHVGNLRTALLNFLAARADASGGGRFLLRIDDTDPQRSEERFVEAIRADLAWMGMVPDGEERQSARLPLYDQAFAALRAAGRVYPAWETAQELDLKRKIALGRGLPPIYDRAALQLGEGERAARMAAGEAPHWRFLLDHDEPIAWDDGVRGPQRFDPAALSDPVIRRADGSWLYMLPSAVDDIDMGVTAVLRGEDHVSNTAVQLQMFTALHAAGFGAAGMLPSFAHFALLTGAEGKLSKRLGSLDLDHFRDTGFEPGALASLLARIGTSHSVEPQAEPGALAAGFDLATFGRAPARFDEAELARVNAQIVHTLGHAAVADRLPPAMDPAAWAAIRPNLATVGEAADWWQVIEGPIDLPEFDPDTRAFLLAAEARLDWGDDVWRRWTGTLKAETGRKGRTLFLPLRQALTGRDAGPEMATLLPLLGEATVRRRLARAAGEAGQADTADAGNR